MLIALASFLLPFRSTSRSRRGEEISRSGPFILANGGIRWSTTEQDCSKTIAISLGNQCWITFVHGELYVNIRTYLFGAGTVRIYIYKYLLCRFLINGGYISNQRNVAGSLLQGILANRLTLFRCRFIDETRAIDPASRTARAPKGNSAAAARRAAGCSPEPAVDRTHRNSVEITLSRRSLLRKKVT